MYRKYKDWIILYVDVIILMGPCQGIFEKILKLFEGSLNMNKIGIINKF